VYNPESDDRALAEIIIAKHRNGPTGTARLVFRPERAEFVNMAHE
jgi:replicative DNA helicase